MLAWGLVRSVCLDLLEVKEGLLVQDILESLDMEQCQVRGGSIKWVNFFQVTGDICREGVVQCRIHGGWKEESAEEVGIIE